MIRIRVLPLALLAMLAVRAASGAPGDAGVTVELSCGKSIALSPQSSALLAETALGALESSEYNSLSPTWHFPVSELRAEYSQALSGQHLAVTFTDVRAMQGRSGALRLRAILIRLGPEARPSAFPDRFVDSIFSIDDKGELVGYALYSGSQVLDLYRAVVQATGGDDPCHLRAYTGNFRPSQDSEQPGARP